MKLKTVLISAGVLGALVLALRVYRTRKSASGAAPMTDAADLRTQSGEGTLSRDLDPPGAT